MGQLFDHGCDAVSLVCAVFITLQTMRVGSGYFYFIYIWVSFGAFYIFNWEEHYQGVLQTNFQGFGVTELLVFQYITVGAHGYVDVSEFTVGEVGSMLFPNTTQA